MSLKQDSIKTLEDFKDQVKDTPLMKQQVKIQEILVGLIQPHIVFPR